MKDGEKIVIRPSNAEDIPTLQQVESSAATSFLELPDLAWIVELPVINEDEHLACIGSSSSWVAEISGQIVGFLVGHTFDGENNQDEDGEGQGDFHIRELSVHNDFQKRGIGSALIEQTVSQCRARGLNRLTLTTFRDVPWNREFYENLGFRVVVGPVDRLLKELIRDKNAGLPIQLRCAMERVLASK